jgi:uncharacterized membrane protein YsdA (DUF1294 family)/cold shock CspA family protein
VDNNIQKGQLKRWNDDKGFGFIKPDSNSGDIFLHISALKGVSRRPKAGDTVFYNIHTEMDGKKRAFNARIDGVAQVRPTIRARSNKQYKKGKISYTIFISILFIAAVCISTLTNNVPLLILPFYLAVSLFTFILYAFDKSAARDGSWRTQESTLHLFALIGGWPGGLIAQQTLRHKSKKQSFRNVFWITVFLNIGVFVWFHTPEGGAILNSFINSVSQVISLAF